MTAIHPTALIDKSVELEQDVSIGPYCVIGADVKIGTGTSFGPGCLVEGPTTIGRHNRFYGHASIGGAAQAKKNAAGGLLIGDNNYVREYVTVNRAIEADAQTVIGSGNWLLACSHVAHDDVLGDHIVVINSVSIGGMVTIGDYANLGGGVLVHQQLRVGAFAIVAGGTTLRKDVPPFAKYGTVDGRVVIDINRIGLERAGFADKVACVRNAYRLLYSKGLRITEAHAEIAVLAEDESFLRPLAEFLAGESVFGVATPRGRVLLEDV